MVLIPMIILFVPLIVFSLVLFCNQKVWIGLLHQTSLIALMKANHNWSFSSPLIPGEK